jgi:hypothetical protein
MTEDDVREMLQARAATVRASADALDRIGVRLEAPARRAPVNRLPLLAAAAVAVVALVGAVLLAQRGEERTPISSGETSTSTTSTPTTSTTVRAQLGVWPLPFDAVDESVFDDPVDTARAYVATRITDVGETTASEYQAGDSNSGEVVFSGHVSTTVLVRKASADRWYVVASASDLLPVHDVGDGTQVMTAGADGTAEGVTYDGDVVANHDPITVHRGDELWRGANVGAGAWFSLTTADGSVALAETAIS